MSQAPTAFLSTLDSCFFYPCRHRAQELDLEDKQLQLDQELRSYLNREGKQDVGRGRHHGAGVCMSLVRAE